jgi:pimeloyl-ACP methyl ester carboxylesterase
MSRRLPHVTAPRLTLLRWLFGLAQAISAGLAATWALRLFLHTYRHPLRAEDAALLAKARHERIAAGGETVAIYDWAGAGPVAIILHGWGSSAARFTLLAQALSARGWRIIAFDAPGHGASTGHSSSLPQFMASLDAIIERYGKPQALIGHSLGALAIACRHRHGAPAWAAALRTVVLISMPSGAEFLLAKFIDVLGLSRGAERHLRQRFQERFAATPPDFASMPGAGRITARVMLAHDRDDDIVPYDHSQALHAQLPAARLLTTEGLGHSKLTRDAATIARIVEFLA